MHIRPANAADLEKVLEIDGTVESTEFLHLERTGEPLAPAWSLQIRPMREKKIVPNTIPEDTNFFLKQIVSGVDEGIALIAEHEDMPVALALAQADPDHGTLRLLELRVDYDHRRQGVATVLVLQLLQHARDNEFRAMAAETTTGNLPAGRLLQKLSFEIAGIDTHRNTNHDRVKESATLFWYAPLD